MMVSGVAAILLVGCLGGILAEVARWYELRTSPNLPAYAHSWFYWIATICMIVAGGLLALAYGTEPKSAILVANIGLSAPVIIKALAASAPVRPTAAFAPGLPRPSLLRFLAGK